MANPGSSSPALLKTSSQANPGSVLPPRERLREEGTEEDGSPRKQPTPWEPTSRWPDYPSKEDCARLSVSKFPGLIPRIFHADGDNATVQEVVLNAVASTRFLRQFEGETIDVDDLTIGSNGELASKGYGDAFKEEFTSAIMELHVRHWVQKIENNIKQRIQTFIDEVRHDDLFMGWELGSELEELLVPLLKLDNIGILKLQQTLKKMNEIELRVHKENIQPLMTVKSDIEETGSTTLSRWQKLTPECSIWEFNSARTMDLLKEKQLTGFLQERISQVQIRHSQIVVLKYFMETALRDLSGFGL